MQQCNNDSVYPHDARSASLTSRRVTISYNIIRHASTASVRFIWCLVYLPCDRSWQPDGHAHAVG